MPKTAFSLYYCVLILGNHLSDGKPICELNKLENASFFPSKIEHNLQRQNYISLVSRVVANSIPCLKGLQDAVMYHIPHQYTKEMTKPTNTVSKIYCSNQQNITGMYN